MRGRNTYAKTFTKNGKRAYMRRGAYVLGIVYICTITVSDCMRNKKNVVLKYTHCEDIGQSYFNTTLFCSIPLVKTLVNRCRSCSSSKYLKVIIICRYICLRFELKAHFACTIFCDLYAKMVQGQIKQLTICVK